MNDCIDVPSLEETFHVARHHGQEWPVVESLPLSNSSAHTALTNLLDGRLDSYDQFEDIGTVRADPVLTEDGIDFELTEVWLDTELIYRR